MGHQSGREQGAGGEEGAHPLQPEGDGVEEEKAVAEEEEEAAAHPLLPWLTEQVGAFLASMEVEVEPLPLPPTGDTPAPVHTSSSVVLAAPPAAVQQSQADSIVGRRVAFVLVEEFRHIDGKGREVRKRWLRKGGSGRGGQEGGVLIDSTAPLSAPCLCNLCARAFASSALPPLSDPHPPMR